MRQIKDLSLGQLEATLCQWGNPVYQAKQIFSWIYKKNAKDFSQMSNLSLELRKRLQEEFSLESLHLAKKEVSQDGTEKFLFALRDNHLIEAVIIPASGRFTGCISSQAGCKFACKFCASGALGLKRNLTPGEMLEQVLLLGEQTPTGKLTHIVFMGTGEPLDNYDNLLQAVRMINSPEGLNIGARRLTISTCGIIPGIKRLAKENLQVELSVSLHAADDKTRSNLMPVNKKYPLKDLIACLREYIAQTNRQVTFEYVLIQGVNSHLPNAKNLATILRDLRLCKVNLIPANPVQELKIAPPSTKEIFAFRDYLRKSAVIVTLRKPRGEDIQAACGQLRLGYEKK